jgi:hypothetical protein
MGSTLAGFDTYLDYARTGELVPQRLVEDINDYYYITQGIINMGSTSDRGFLEIQYLASKIIMELDVIPLGPLPV